jgi:hypothetical protein
VQDGTGTGIHSAVVCATGRAVVLESRAHLAKYEVVYTSDPLARINGDRIQLIQNVALCKASRCQLFEMRGLAWCRGGHSPTPA